MEKLAVLAVVVQVLTESVVRLGLQRFTLFVAAFFGLTVALLTKTGLLSSLGAGDVAWPPADWVLAGLVLAGGAGLVQALKQGLKGGTPPQAPSA